MYKVAYSDHVEKDLKRLDKSTTRKILKHIEQHLAQDPHGLGKPLKDEFDGCWRYRYGDYRIIYKIAEKKILIIVLRIGHRKSIYQ
jgi:mRNA interferase RelE/StbE